MKQRKPFNLSYMTPVTVPIFMIGFKSHSTTVIVAASLLLAFFVVGGIRQKKRQTI